MKSKPDSAHIQTPGGWHSAAMAKIQEPDPCSKDGSFLCKGEPDYILICFPLNKNVDCEVRIVRGVAAHYRFVRK